jgi:hypothetical protein
MLTCNSIYYNHSYFAILFYHWCFTDPHFRMFDGTKYSYHGECDLVFTRGIHSRSEMPIDIHARTTIIDGWSLISSAAIRIGKDILEIVNDGSFFVNGVTNMEIPFMMSERFNVSKGEQIMQEASENDEEKHDTEITYKIELDGDDDDYITVTIWKTMIAIRVNSYLTNSEGMLGVHGKEGMVGRDRQTVFDDANLMGAEWQVRDTEAMLFHDTRTPQYPMECTLPKAQTSRRRLRENDHLMSRAKVVCAGVDDEMVAFCIDDVLRTGDEYIAIGYSARY